MNLQENVGGKSLMSEEDKTGSCYCEVDLCLPRLPFAYSMSGDHSSGWNSGFKKWAVL
jgi:hypothetical protein